MQNDALTAWLAIGSVPVVLLVLNTWYATHALSVSLDEEGRPRSRAGERARIAANVTFASAIVLVVVAAASGIGWLTWVNLGLSIGFVVAVLTWRRTQKARSGAVPAA